MIIHKGKIQENIWKKNFGIIRILNVIRRDEVVNDNIMTTKSVIYHDFPSTDL
jgi:hypothetical protein